jgi:hypothetical protein
LDAQEQEQLEEMMKFRRKLEKQKISENIERMRRRIWLNLFLMMQQQLLK